MKIEDVCLVGDGAHARIKRHKSGVLYLTSKNFKGEGLDLSKTDYISEEDYKKHFCKQSDTVTNVKKDDLVFSIIGSIGSPYVVREGDCFGLSSSVAILRPDPQKVNSKYLYYWILGDFFQEYVNNIKSGVAQGFLSLGMIKKLPVRLPPIVTQVKIANVLSTYDKLIENNNRRIEVLEQAAEEIYKEWFVRMRFPGYENSKFDKGIPEHWEVRKVNELVDRFRYGTLYKKENVEEEGKVIVIDQSEKEFLGYHNETADHFADINNPFILFGDHSCKMLVMTKPFSLSENVIPFKSKDDIPELFLYYTVKDLVKTTEYKRHWAELINKKVLIPKRSLQFHFEKRIKNNFKLIQMYKHEKRNLIKQRNLLLPRIMNGTIEVK
jgi:type I restriction enzyme, S subunit